MDPVGTTITQPGLSPEFPEPPSLPPSLPEKPVMGNGQQEKENPPSQCSLTEPVFGLGTQAPLQGTSQLAGLG